MRVALPLVGALGLSLVAFQIGSPQAAQAKPLAGRYQPPPYLSNGWICNSWTKGNYHGYRCTQRPNGGPGGQNKSGWVPNSGGSSHAAPARPAPPVRTAPTSNGASGSVPSMIRSVFGPYADGALNIARCESGFNPNSYNPSSGASGVFQFLPSTWRGTSYGGSSPFNASANIHAAYEVFQRDGYSWGEWVCRA
jgi:hypothetical protein